MTENELSELLDQSNEISKQVRSYEDLAKKYGISIDNDNLYAALKAHRVVLQDLIRDFKRNK